MPEIQKLIESLGHKKKTYVDGMLPPDMFADEVVGTLSGVSASEYNIFDIFSKKIIEDYILSPGEDYMRAALVGGKIKSIVVSYDKGAREADHSEMIPLYQKVFREWEEQGWIMVDENSEDVESPISIKIHDQYS